MAEDKPISPKAANEYIRKAATELLHANEVYELDSYGWLNANDTDPDYIGHAIAQTDLLSFRILDARMAFMQSQAPSVPELAPWQKFLITSGGDFEGLMDTARLSIGLALFQREVASLARFQVDSLFQLHLISALVTLGAASDRLRDFFIAAVFKKETPGYEKGQWRKKGDRRSFETPFGEAKERLQNVTWADKSVAKLQVLASDIQKFRLVRNIVVHSLATETGRQHHELANSPPTLPYNYELDFDQFREQVDQAEALHSKRIVDGLNRPIQWYRLLAETSNHVFIVENVLRRQSRS